LDQLNHPILLGATIISEPQEDPKHSDFVMPFAPAFSLPLFTCAMVPWSK